jgi:hypothetical protein
MEPPINTAPPEPGHRAQHKTRRDDDQPGGVHPPTLARAAPRRDVTYAAD